MRFSLGQLDVADKFGIGYFFPLGMACLETNNMVLVTSTSLEGRRDLPPPCARRKKLLTVETSQVAFSGTDRRVWREDLAPVMVAITVATVATMGCGWLWQVCLVGYQCGGEVGTLGRGKGFTLGSDGVRTLGRDEGSFPIFGGR